MRPQKYEGLAKALLAQSEIAGPPIELEAIRAAKIESMAKNGLSGALRGLQRSYLSPQADDSDLLAEYESANVMAVAFRVNFPLEEADSAEAARALDELVSMRNDLIHRFIEMFDLSSMDGCQAARAHLDDCIEQVDDRFRQLRMWADAFDQARTAFAALTQTAEFRDALRQAVLSDPIAAWRDLSVVAALRKAFHARAVEGWAKLTDAVALIAETHPEETPERYGCRSWQHVLHASSLFEVQRRPRAGGGFDRWYRERV
ncbi:MAG TPA: OST-HTH/LOTUS domain-containing protein, partial [Sphingomonadaceae bacterium]|nr:OST-HTH/LOTUS domain-containing protein [Sphingomonadaceae bacterium]